MNPSSLQTPIPRASAGWPSTASSVGHLHLSTKLLRSSASRSCSTSSTTTHSNQATDSSSPSSSYGGASAEPRTTWPGCGVIKCSAWQYQKFPENLIIEYTGAAEYYEVLPPRLSSTMCTGIDFAVSRGGVDVLDNEIVIIDLKIRVSLPKGHYGRLVGRSSFQRNDFLVIEGTIDSDYTGSLKLVVKYLLPVHSQIPEHTYICQLIVSPYMHISSFYLPPHKRRKYGNEGGFGSTDL
ncbi:unnamed protein product [Callosobruchus maculatus]|uniref:dUTPase-like domain-containing protein n=1 Tax=Callosobruchus maculatus TaxID=64391 RepID=A0A653C7B4_CALMS|nr:unnamed protein product [Callosobruchus maculatus]